MVISLYIGAKSSPFSYQTSLFCNFWLYLPHEHDQNKNKLFSIFVWNYMAYSFEFTLMNEYFSPKHGGSMRREARLLSHLRKLKQTLQSLLSNTPYVHIKSWHVFPRYESRYFFKSFVDNSIRIRLHSNRLNILQNTNWLLIESFIASAYYLNWIFFKWIALGFYF